MQNYGNADYDIRHSLNGNYLITVPYFGGPRLLTDNWQVGGTLFWHRGFPFSVVDSNVTDALEPNYGNLATTWMLAYVVNAATPHHCGKAGTNTPCFGGAATTDFANPTSFGGQRRNQFTGPGYFNTDLSVLKGFKAPGLESGKVQVGAQAYNVLNHPNFQNPDFDFRLQPSDPSSARPVRRPVSSVRSWVATHLRVLSNSKPSSSSDVSGEVCAVSNPFAADKFMQADNSRFERLLSEVKHMRRFNGIRTLAMLLFPVISVEMLLAAPPDLTLLSLVPPGAQIVAGVTKKPSPGKPGSFLLMTRNNVIDRRDFMSLAGVDDSMIIHQMIFAAGGSDTSKSGEHSLLIEGISTRRASLRLQSITEPRSRNSEGFEY